MTLQLFQRQRPSYRPTRRAAHTVNTARPCDFAADPYGGCRNALQRQCETINLQMCMGPYAHDRPYILILRHDVRSQIHAVGTFAGRQKCISYQIIWSCEAELTFLRGLVKVLRPRLAHRSLLACPGMSLGYTVCCSVWPCLHITLSGWSGIFGYFRERRL